MTLRYDETVDVLHVQFRETTVTTVSLCDGLVVEYDADGHVAGLELLDATMFLQSLDLDSLVTYVPVGDVLYLSIGPPLPATNCILSDDDVIVRYSGDAIIGCTILHASKRLVPAAR